jgi:hypothetical protein
MGSGSISVWKEPPDGDTKVFGLELTITAEVGRGAIPNRKIPSTCSPNLLSQVK